MRMLRDNLLVKELTKEQLGKIVLPDNIEDDDWKRGKVIAAGPGNLNMHGDRIPLETVVGDIVVFPPAMGGNYPMVTVDGEEYIIFNEKFVWAIEGD